MEMQPDETLFEAIRRKCQQDGWYGPQLGHPQWIEVDADDPRRKGFEFAPVTEAQVQATEEMVGFPLLLFLRTLYTTIANGGFGPGGGLRGMLGGFESPGSGYVFNSDDTLGANYLFWSGERTGEIDLEAPMREQLQAQEIVEIQRGLWPRQLLPICDMGDAQEACIDNHTGQLFFVVALHDHKKYGLQQKKWTFEEWLWRWTRAENIY